MPSLKSIVALVLCIQIFQVQLVFGQKCSFLLEDETEISTDKYNLPTIKDIEEAGKELLVVKAVNVISIVPPDSESNRVYIEATLANTADGKNLVLKLTELFVDYEEYETEPTTSIFVEFTCTDGGRKIEFIQPIEDTNNHAPGFENNPYTYNLPMPLPKNLALDKFVSISARDIDLSNTHISFSLDSDTSGFSVSWLSRDSTDIKRHYATLVTTAIISLTEDLTFNLHATDDGVPPKTSTTTVTIRVDQANSILRFAQTLYIANLTYLKFDDEVNGLTVPFSKIGLASGADTTVEYSIYDELSDYEKNFELLPAADHSSVQLKLIEPPESLFLESFIVLSLMATKPGANEKTVLQILLPGMNREISLSEKETIEQEKDDYRIATIALGILLGISVIGHVGFGYFYYRYWKK